MIDAPKNYYQLHEMKVNLHGQELRVLTKPGFANWDRITPATQLLASSIELPPHLRSSSVDILVMGSGHGALGVALSGFRAGGRLCLADTTISALKCTEQTMRANGVAGAAILEDPLAISSMAEQFDLAAIELPKGRTFTRRWLLEAYNALKPGASLYLAGANDEGIQPAIKDAGALFGNAGIHAYKKGSRVARMIKNPTPINFPAWAQEPGVKPGTWIKFDVHSGGRAYPIRSLPGVFAANGLDEGTAFLLEHLPPLGESRVLDAGCGYGIIGLAAWHAGASKVDMIDNHLLSIVCARENIRLNRKSDAPKFPFSPEDTAPAIRAFPADGLDVPGDSGYTHVISNPPFHAGKATDSLASQTFIAQALQLLRPRGQLILVANRFLRYDRTLKNLFGNLTVVAETGKYFVLSSTKEKDYRGRKN